MKDPIEMATREYLPWVRAVAALKLRGGGLSQARIAKYLGVTQPSVALYLRRTNGFYLAKAADLGVPESLTSRHAERMAALSSGDDSGAALASLEIASEVLGTGSLCVHHRAEAGLPESCDVCLKFFSVGAEKERSGALRELEEAVRLLESSSTFPLLIPGVLTNFVFALPDAKDERDVAGIAGRIASVKGRAKAASSPEFGASRYTARIVLTVRDAFKGVSSGLNVRYDPRVGDTARSLGWRRIDVDRDEARSDPLKSIAGLCAELEGPPDLVVESGSLGLEPSAYVLGSSPAEVAEKALTLAGFHARKARAPR
ncbi:MAG TPA: thiamine-phosphate synthase family protein [Conexivisphaerales archaeon]|nr:thiamine-phosphate synthase family protein [Conexivisphaerales archaeon]